MPPKTGNAVEATSAASRQPQATTNCFCDKIRQVTRGPNRLGGGGLRIVYGVQRAMGVASCNLKGCHSVNVNYIRVTEPERLGKKRVRGGERAKPETETERILWKTFPLTVPEIAFKVWNTANAFPTDDLNVLHSSNQIEFVRRH